MLLQAAELQTDTDFLEDKEETLVSDCVRHLDSQGRRLQALQDELADKSEVCVRQQEEITALMSKCIAYDSRLKKVCCRRRRRRRRQADAVYSASVCHPQGFARML